MNKKHKQGWLLCLLILTGCSTGQAGAQGYGVTNQVTDSNIEIENPAMDEYEISNIEKDNLMIENQDYYDMRIELTSKEKVQQGLLGTSILESRQEKSWAYYLRTGTSMLGIAVCIYAVLLILGYAFDRANTLLDISVVSLITLNKFAVDMGKHNTKAFAVSTAGVNYISRAKFWTMTASILLLGICLASGVFFTIIT